MKNFGRIVKCTAAAAACVLTLSGCENYNKMMDETPQEYVQLASENTTEAMVKSAFADEMAIIKKAAEEGTVGFSFDFEDVNFSAEAYVNEADKKTSQTYTVEKNGEKVEFYVAVDDNVLKAGEKGNSGENIFEIDTNTLLKDFKNSVFAPGSGSEYEITQEDYDMAVEYIEQIISAIEGEEDSDSYDEIIEIYNDMMSDADVEKKADVTIDGTDVKANIITYSFNKSDVRKLMDATIDVTVDEMEKQGEAIDVEEASAEIDELMESIEKFDMEIVYYVNSKTHCLMQIDCIADITVTEYDEPENVNFNMITTYGADPANSEEVTVEVEAEFAGEKASATIVSERKSEDETEVTIEASMQGMTMELVVLNFERDDKDYTISAEIPILEATATIKGTLKSDSKSVEATVDSVTYAVPSDEIEGNLEDFNIKCSIEQGGKFDDRDAENIFKLSEDEINTYIENIGNDINVLAGNSAVTDSMLGYIGQSNLSSANANAKQVHTAFSAALTQMAIEGVELNEYEYYNEANGDINVILNGYDLDLVSYLGESFTGYYYVNFDPSTYAVKYALWSEEPIDYFYQYGEFDQEMFAEEGQYIGCYPLSEY